MKKLIATTLAGVLLGVVAHAQGTVNFANAGAGLNQAVYLNDGTTKVSGANFDAELWAGPSAASLALVGTATPFLSGGGAGYFNGGVITIGTVAPGTTGFFEVWAWDTTLGGTTTGATLAAAQTYAAAGNGNVYGFSAVFQNTTGGPTPTPPATLTSFTSFHLNAVPEPTTFALAGLGAAAALFFRRRK